MVYQSHTQLYTLIADNPSVLPLLNRFDIRLGVGHNSIRQAAEIKGVDDGFLLAMINTYLNSDYFPESELKEFPLHGIADYLLRTDRYYLEVQLPNIDRHFRHLVDHSYSPDTNLNKLYEYFSRLHVDFRREISEKDKLLACVIGECGNVDASVSAVTKESMREYISGKCHQSYDALADLINLFIIHLRGTYDTNLCNAVIIALISLARDMHQNNRIHDRILLPMLQTLI